MSDEAAFVDEVLRINGRYTREIVESLNVCPYARGARTTGRAIREVMLQRDTAPEPSLELIARLEADARPLEVIQVIYPRLRASTPREFERFNASIRDARAARRDSRPVFVHAAFHPDYPCDRRSPDALVYYFRRAPDPMIQLVRHETIEDVRGPDHGTILYDPETFVWPEPGSAPHLSITERITRDNWDLVEREGVEKLDAIYRSIAEDRARAYARFGET